jgi:hypothetical protein
MALGTSFGAPLRRAAHWSTRRLRARASPTYLCAYILLYIYTIYKYTVYLPDCLPYPTMPFHIRSGDMALGTSFGAPPRRAAHWSTRRLRARASPTYPCAYILLYIYINILYIYLIACPTLPCLSISCLIFVLPCLALHCIALPSSLPPALPCPSLPCPYIYIYINMNVLSWGAHSYW